MANDGTGTGWSETSPANTESVSDGAQEIRDLRKGLRIRLEKEHEDMGATSAGGEHLAGSAKAYYQSAAPTQRPDTATPTTLDGDDNGRLFVDSDDNKIYCYVHGTGFVQCVGDVPNGTIDTAQLAADAVDGTKIADDAVNSEHIADGAIDLAHMSVDSVDSAQYVDASIDPEHTSWHSLDATAANGSLTLPGGIIIKWGKASAATSQTITFGTAFPTAIFSVVITEVDVNNRLDFAATVDSVTTSSFQINGSSGADEVNWIAIGN